MDVLWNRLSEAVICYDRKRKVLLFTGDSETFYLIKLSQMRVLAKINLRLQSTSRFMMKLAFAEDIISSCFTGPGLKTPVILCAHQDYNTISTIDLVKRERKRVDFRLDRGHVWFCKSNPEGITVSGLARGFKFLCGFQETISLCGKSLSRSTFPNCQGYPLLNPTLKLVTSRSDQYLVSRSLSRDLSIQSLIDGHQSSIRFKQLSIIDDSTIVIRDMYDNVVVVNYRC